MSHVTGTLNALEAKMSELVRIRNARIHHAEQEIREANRQFDRHAIPLGRQINELRAEIAATQERDTHATRTHRTVTHNLEGLTDQERDHYQQLQTRKS